MKRSAPAVLAGLALAAVLVPWPSAAATARGEKPVVVAVLPQVGTVYALSTCANQHNRWSLGFRALRNWQTANVVSRAGKRISHDRTVQPGGPTTWFPSSARRVQQLAAAAGGENGTVVAVVRATGWAKHGDACWFFNPPRVTVQLYPRRYYYRPNFLRHLLERQP